MCSYKNIAVFKRQKFEFSKNTNTIKENFQFLFCKIFNFLLSFVDTGVLQMLCYNLKKLT